MKRLLFSLFIFVILGASMLPAAAQNPKPITTTRVNLKQQASTPANPSSTFWSLFADSSGNIKVLSSGGVVTTLATTAQSGVTSVFGRTGAVVKAASDYDFADLGNKPTTLSGYGITDAAPLNPDYLDFYDQFFAPDNPSVGYSRIYTRFQRAYMKTGGGEFVPFAHISTSGITNGRVAVFSGTNEVGDYAYLFTGAGSPEGVQAAGVGSIYQDLTSGYAYVKLTGTGNTGWIRSVILTEIVQLQTGTPSAQAGKISLNQSDGSNNILTVQNDTGTAGRIFSLSGYGVYASSRTGTPVRGEQTGTLPSGTTASAVHAIRNLTLNGQTATGAVLKTEDATASTGPLFEAVRQSVTFFKIGASASPIVEVIQPTVGSSVQSLKSTATNDDPETVFVQDRIAVTDATLTTLHTFATTSDTVIRITSVVLARRTGGSAGTAGDGASYEITATFKNIGGTVTQIGATTRVDNEDQSAWDCDFSISSTNVLLRFSGATNNNVTVHLSEAKVAQVGS